MFDLNRHYNQCYNWPIVVPIIDQTHTFQCVIPMGENRIGLAMNRLVGMGLNPLTLITVPTVGECSPIQGAALK